MKIEINFEYFPQFQNRGDYISSNSCFEIEEPKINLNKKIFEDVLKINFKEQNIDYDEDCTIINFHQYQNKIFIEFYLKLYEEDKNKIKINESIENIILDILFNLSSDLYNLKLSEPFMDIKVELEFWNAIFYNTYNYKRLIKKQISELSLKKSIGEVGGKLTRFKTFLKKTNN